MLDPNDTIQQKLTQALWRIYHRPERPTPWSQGGNLPWDEPEFSARMLREHLDQAHGAASRIESERLAQINWLWARLGLQPEQHICDMTCGPGLYAVELAARGCTVTGIDFAPAAIQYARQLVTSRQVADRCQFIEQDVRTTDLGAEQFDHALFLYGQLAVFRPEEAQQLLATLARALKPGGRLAIELLNQDRVDKSSGQWWYTDHTGLWGDGPFLHLGERFWDEAAQMSLDRFHVLHLETGKLDEVLLCDQTYSVATMKEMLHKAGFATVEHYVNWDGVPIYDAAEWVVYVAQK
jgi:SAM-dependent methyltransferase